MLLYALITGEDLFRCNYHSQLTFSDKVLLHSWGCDTKAAKLSLIKDVYAYNLLDQLLYKEKHRRPTIDRVLSHPYVTKVAPVRMMGMGYKFDVCLVYRRKNNRVMQQQLQQLQSIKYSNSDCSIPIDCCDDTAAVNTATTAETNNVSSSDNNNSSSVRRIEMRERVRDDDNHYDILKALIMSELQLTVCDCYDSRGEKKDDGVSNFSNLISSRHCVVLLSRYAINHEDNSIEQLNDKGVAYDHYLYQL